MSEQKPWPDPTPVDAELLSELRRGVIEYDTAVVTSVCRSVIDRRMDAYMAIFDGLVAGLEEVGRLYDCQEYFVPELLICSDTLYAGLQMLKPYIRNDMVATGHSKGEVVIGAIEGDIHDIGKNLVKMVFEIAGFNVHDLGCDVSVSRFADAIVKTGASLALVSNMMSTCLPGVKRLAREIRKAAPDTIIMIGGASINDGALKKVDCDGTAKSAHGALRQALDLIATARKIKA